MRPDVELTVVLAPGAAPPPDIAPLRAQGYAVQIVPDAAAGARALRSATTPIAVLHRLERAPPLDDYEPLIGPIERGEADAVFAVAARGHRSLRGRALQQVGRWMRLPLSGLGTGVSAFRTEALRDLALTPHAEGVEAQFATELSSRSFTVREELVDAEGLLGLDLREGFAQFRGLSRPADPTTESIAGFTTLERMQGAVNYSAWLGKKFRPHLGKRVLEVGAGLGSVTEQLAPQRELLIALEVEERFVARLRQRFRHLPQVRPLLSGVEQADWEALSKEQLDTVVLSNVLEHIEDDAAAVQNFRRVLPEGGTLLLFVPALPALFGTIDRAIGHFRRYTPSSLRRVVAENGFRVESLEWMNLLGIPGWYVNGKLLRRQAVPPLQLRLYDRLAPLLARLESHVRLPVGMSLLLVARASGGHA